MHLSRFALAGACAAVLAAPPLAPAAETLIRVEGRAGTLVPQTSIDLPARGTVTLRDAFDRQVRRVPAHSATAQLGRALAGARVRLGFGVFDFGAGPLTFVERIGPDANLSRAPFTFWRLSVNHRVSRVGADQVRLRPGDEVVWAYANSGDGVLDVRTSTSSALWGDRIGVTVRLYDVRGRARPARGATVRFNGAVRRADARGRAHFKARGFGARAVTATARGAVRGSATVCISGFVPAPCATEAADGGEGGQPGGARLLARRPGAGPGARAAGWLARRPAGSMPAGQLADAIVALRANGRGATALRSRLAVLARKAPRYAVTPGAAGKVVLAAVAAGRDPRRLGGVNYVRRVTHGATGGRYGASTFDQALGMLALRSAGRGVPAPAVRAMRAARGSGGWGFSRAPRGRDSVDATALAIEAMRAAGVPARDPFLRAATRWMLAQRNRAGGYASAGGGGATEANSTAAVLRALHALGRPAPPRTRAALRALQRRDGAVRFTRRWAGSPLLATNDAAVAFAGRHLPVAVKTR